MQFLAYLLAVHSASSFVSGLGVHIDIELPPKPYIQRGEAHAPALHQANPERHLDSSAADDFVVEFGHGKHRGDLSDDGSYILWSNIPYAAPPDVTDSRWATPIPPEYQEGVKHDTSTKTCPQAQNDSGTEDCLYLDVYVPKEVWDTRNDRKVIYPTTAIWIHGGDFTSGSKHNFTNPDGLFEASKDQDNETFVFVAINYRLGIFGWLGGSKFRNDYGTINLGLEDQRTAIEWVSNEISNFGGSRNRMQLIGQGAGAASIIHHYTYKSGFHYYTPRFQGATLLSPGFTESPSDDELNAKYAEILAAAGVKDLDGLAACDSSKLLQINRDQISTLDKGQIFFGPTTGSDAYPDSPGKLLRDGKFFKKISALVGYTTEDDPVNQCYVHYLTKAIMGSEKSSSMTFAHRYIFNADPVSTGADLNYLFYPQEVTPGASADIQLAKRYQKFIVNRLRYWDPNDDPEKEDWPTYKKQGDKVMVFGHGGQDYDWKLEKDPMSADDVAECDRVVSGMAQGLSEHVLQSQTPHHHMEMV
ncbi:hypothetical protein EG327_008422 [Venturia inaequalis]|uniref:Carboxylesterase type B domain-containing protein n=1 Tax=Venturia inaequalis TaxID=5025 RepID=A0A8H3US46_VENIN|nr:hypothetical protein EG327_008422 [Venturia inaequalis]